MYIPAHSNKKRNPSPVNTAAIADTMTSAANDFCFAAANCNVKNHAVNTKPTDMNPKKYWKKFSTSTGGCSISFVTMLTTDDLKYYLTENV